ncbi:uncharacterized protein LOC118512332 isoform X1 [Anopheles stephensi]|uniref:uncharacterized protein LOC118512332 isoform X1 n=1 Tax=Anopheles stephensi TaxID=30069 RepID=UPI0016587EDE|nr:uncharacterized protein LOC118512332 isoform X1 [Anopheles stephensi]XP_035912520.1 uncharacterized protein LOC118512332 isoform X1 [Anopheles stephensi]
MILINNKEPTFISSDPNKRDTAIDLTIVSPDIVQETRRIVCDQHIGNSGHKLIYTFIQEPTIPTNNKIINKALVEEQIRQLKVMEHTTMASIAKDIKKIIKNNTRNCNYTPKSWWTEELKIAWEKKNESRKKFNTNKTLENHIEFKKDLAKFKLLKKIEKRKNFEKWLDKVNTDTTSTELWNIINKCHGKKGCKQYSNLINSSHQNAKKFLKINFPISKHTTNNLMRTPLLYDSEIKLLNLDKWHKILKSKNNTTPGVDGITYDTLKILNDEMALKIIEEINAMYREGKVPHRLKRIKIIAIGKIGKDLNEITNFRPIALLMTILKVANTAVLSRITDYLEKHLLLPETSFGFRKNRSTTDMIDLLINTITGNNRKKKYTGVVFIDVKNAYNSVLSNELTAIMQSLTITNDVIAWISSFLKNRSLEISVDGETIKRRVSNGLPQGDVLSPTLFNIYTSSCHDINMGKIKLLQYADDFVIIETGLTQNAVENSIQRSLNWLTLKLKELNLEINPQKCTYMTFPKNNFNVNIQTAGRYIQKTKEHRFLGVTIDSQLKFHQHLENQKSKATKRLNAIKTICNFRNHIDPEKAIQVHRALIRGSMEYGIGFSLNATKTKLKTIDTILNQSLRRVTGCTKTTPTNTLYAIAAEIPFAIRSKYLVAKQLVKTVAYPSKNMLILNKVPDSNNILKLSATEKIYKENQEILSIVSKISFNYLNNNYQYINVRENVPGLTEKKNNCNPLLVKQLSIEMINSNKAKLKIFTDGSKNSNGCGIGIYIIKEKEIEEKLAFKLQNEVSVCTTELYAIKKALEYAVLQRIRKPTIYTDSKSACILIKQATEYQYTDDIISRIINNCEYLEATIQWIPSHVNIEGNEIADELAKEGTRSNLIINNRIRFKDAIAKLQEKTRQETDRWYTDMCVTKGKKFEKYQSKIEKKMWHHKMKLSPRDIKIINRLIAGHDYSNYWLQKFKVIEDGICRTCNIPDTGRHRIFHCIRFETERTKDKIPVEEAFINSWKAKQTQVIQKVLNFIQANKIKF